jgi:hypothetical protein
VFPTAIERGSAPTTPDLPDNVPLLAEISSPAPAHEACAAASASFHSLIHHMAQAAAIRILRRASVGA